MTSCELVDGIYRKVPIENASSICMLFGRVEVVDFMNVIWKDAPELQALLRAAADVFEKPPPTLAVSTTIKTGQKRYMEFFPSSQFSSLLHTVFMKARVPVSLLNEKIDSRIWKLIEEKAERTKVTSECDRVKRNMDAAEEFLLQHYDDFVAEYPDYKYVARTLSNINKTKRRKIIHTFDAKK